MNINLDKGQVEEVLQGIRNEKADALIAEGMNKIREIGKYEGMMKLSKNMLLWSGGAYVTSALMRKATNKSLGDITDKLSELQN